MSPQSILPSDYGDWLKSLKSRIASARQRAALSVNQELITLYHSIGTDIIQRQTNEGWGAKVIQRLSSDLGEAFPDMKGFSTRNLHYMRLFAEHCPKMQFVQQSAAQLPWFHIVSLLTKISDPASREWYAARAILEGWSRPTLDSHIKSQLHRREGAAITNFERHLPTPQAQLALAALKDPYLFDFLGLGDDAHERDIENALIRHITRFLLELGAGFAFLGRQYRLEVGGDEFFMDLLFYHTRLKCHVVVELKSDSFKPEHAGKLNFYLAAVDAQIKAPDDKPTIGLLLCKTKNHLVAEYALSGMEKPIGIAEYQLVRALPEPLDTCLPSIEEIEAELGAHSPEES
ncbi:MAG: PDDEXK nuclease domain-containing protein [Verrucomicrobiota bacterium]